MKLQKGITGFWHTKDAFNSPKFLVSQLEHSLFPLEYTGNKSYKLIGFKDKFGPHSYHRLAIKDISKNQIFDILINTTYPYYCGVLADSLVDFIDLPQELVALADPAFEYLSLEELNTRINDKDLNELTEYERKQIKWWKAKTFGEVIFNFWD